MAQPPMVSNTCTSISSLAHICDHIGEEGGPLQPNEGGGKLQW